MNIQPKSWKVSFKLSQQLCGNCRCLSSADVCPLCPVRLSRAAVRHSSENPKYSQLHGDVSLVAESFCLVFGCRLTLSQQLSGPSANAFGRETSRGSTRPSLPTSGPRISFLSWRPSEVTSCRKTLERVRRITEQLLLSQLQGQPSALPLYSQGFLLQTSAVLSDCDAAVGCATV